MYNAASAKPRMSEDIAAAFRLCRPHLAAAVGFSALANVLYLAPSIYMMQVYDRVLPTGGQLTLFYLTLVVAFALAVLAVLDMLRGRLMIKLALRMDRLLSEQVMARLLAQAGAGPRAGQMMRDFDQVRAGLSGPGAAALFDAPWTPFYLLVAFLIHPLLGLLATGGAVLLFALAAMNEAATKQHLQQAAAAMNLAYAAEETLGSHAEVVRALGMRRALTVRHLHQRHRALSQGTGAQFVGGGFSGLIKFLRLFLQSLALGLGAWLAVRQQISSGSVIAASILLSRSLQPVEQLVGAWAGVVQARAAFDNLNALFEGTRSPDAPRTRLPSPAGRLELSGVVVRAPAGAGLLLRGISFRVSPGEILGVVGHSGSGKSTLAKVAANAWSAHQGDVRLDGAGYADWDSDRLGAHLGYMPQEVSLFPGTVKENISRYGDWEDVDRLDAAVVAAAKASGAHDMILRLPAGYDTALGPAARGLSAGQSQRIALARALFDDPALLVLDEPNAFLDAEGEDALVRALMAARARGAGVLIIAHRLGVLGAADRILVLRDGVVDRIGDREKVLASRAAQSAPPSPAVSGA